MKYYGLLQTMSVAYKLSSDLSSILPKKNFQNIDMRYKVYLASQAPPLFG